MFESPFIGLAILAVVIIGLAVLQRLEFMSVFTRRRRRTPPGDRNPSDGRSPD
ncbi:MAG TPA: hypothetical protein VIL69_19605 [Roseomonas sp.]